MERILPTQPLHWGRVPLFFVLARSLRAVLAGGSMFSRIANLFKGFLSLFVSGVERRNPEALLELEQENLRKQIGNFNQGLASHAGLAERLMSQVQTRSRTERPARQGHRTPACG